MSDGPVVRVKSTAHEWVNRLRDRRRTTRRRLEDIFDRQTFTSIAVVGALGKLLETSLIPFLDWSAAVPVERLVAWTVVFAASLVVSVRWEKVANTAEEVGDTVEESTDPDG